MFAKGTSVLRLLGTFGFATVGAGVFWKRAHCKTENESEVTEMWIWGHGEFTPQPDFRSQFENFVPRKIVGALETTAKGVVLRSKMPRFSSVVIKQNRGYSIDTDGKVYIFDFPRFPSFIKKRETINVGGQEVDKYDVIHNLRSTNFPAKAKTVVVTEKYAWALAHNGDLYSLFLEDLAVSKWTRYKGIGKLKAVSAGNNHLLMLQQNGELFAMGDHTFGQCGSGFVIEPAGRKFEVVKLQEPSKVELPDNQKVTKIFSKSDHNVIITEKNETYVFGKNNKMQLGFFEEFSDLNRPLLAIFQPRSIQKQLDSFNCDLKDVAMGDDFTLYHCINKETKLTQVFGVGSNVRGQLTGGTNNFPQDYKMLEPISELVLKNEYQEIPLSIKNLVCGNSHCVANMDSEGLALIWGNNEDGQIGNRDNRESPKPKVVSVLKNTKIDDIYADETTTIAYVRRRVQKESK